MGSSGVKNDAFAIQGQNNAVANSAYNTVNPVYSAFAQGNQGYTPAQMANANTALMQAQGGTQAAALGAGNLAAARTGNIGGYGTAIDSAARQSGVTASQGALQVQSQSDQLAHQNQLIGLQGEQNLYGTSDEAQIRALDAANQAQSPFWKQALLAGIKGAASGAAGGL